MNSFFMKNEKGQSLVEFLVLSLALVPLFLLIPMIAKYQDISHSTQMASRYVAFEAANRNSSVNSFKSEAELATEVRERFFSSPNAAIKTAKSSSNTENEFWKDLNGNNLIANKKDIKLTFGVAKSTTHQGGFSSASDAQPFVLANRYGLPSLGIYRANITVALANLPSGIKSIEPFDKINLSMSRQTSVIVDPWMANSPQQVDQRSERIMEPAHSLAQMAASPVNAAHLFIEGGYSGGPSVGELQKWRDVVPNDRLMPQR